MVARGDLGVEIPPQKVPAYQKYILQRCLEEGKFAITATQMLDSMQDNPRPTRAEVSDVANAVYDGTGATMLSGESANGDYPIESVKMMSLIDEETEADLDYELNFETELRDFEPETIATSVAQAAVMASFNLEADIIVAVTNDVEEVGQISKFRPEAPIVIGFTNARAARQASLHWGVVPVIIEEGDNQIEKVKAAAAEKGLLEAGHLVIELDGCECKGLTSMKVTEYEG